ncbi:MULTISPECIES: hypothetical protein [Pseudomonas]|uniref:Uncharacterized membrane protein n=1 Tax=Pseudomonas segetis TaxID=298908 RepID=A0A238ZGP7_9PSED|nr:MULTISPECIES: hypothetical protein [Pseudomonas]SNR82645.1 Uncharacterized membrane protein [Pseudomonas segetis]
MFKFLKTTALGGVLFILPLILIGVLIEKAVHLLRGPISKMLPVFDHHSVAGITALTITALLALLLLCFLAGLLAKTRAAKRVRDSIEDKLLDNVPGYRLIKDTMARMAGVEEEVNTQVGLYVDGDIVQFCLIVGSAPDWTSVFIPDGGSAGLTAGAVQIVPSAHVHPTELSWFEVLKCLKRNGHGSMELAQPWLPGSQPD